MMFSEIVCKVDLARCPFKTDSNPESFVTEKKRVFFTRRLALNTVHHMRRAPAGEVEIIEKTGSSPLTAHVMQ